MSLPTTQLGTTGMHITRVGFGAWAIGGGDWAYGWGTAVDEHWESLAALKASGKVRAIGLSNHDVPALEPAEKVAHVDSLQPPFSAVQRKNAAEISWCHDNGTRRDRLLPHAVRVAHRGVFRDAGVARRDGRDRGGRRPDQIDGWLSAASLELTAEDLAEIAAAIESTGAGWGPARP